MCGIAGFISLRSNTDRDQAILDVMTDTLAHRGPNDRGTELLSLDGERVVGLGHRRLTIIDLTRKGHQPMANHSGDIILSYNGEVYNYIELKEELVRLRHRFESSSDTEVVLKSYEQWGTDCFARFNGMWATAIFDGRRRKLILSRGRFGQKPLYYYQQDGLFLFASEPKAIFAHPAAKKAPNYDKIFRYLAYNYRYVDIDDESYFAGVRHVPKGSFLEVDANLEISIRPYWTLNHDRVSHDISDAQAVDRYRELFIDAVRLRLRSDVPVGCMLSGGLDSTAITAVACKVLGNRIKTFSGITGEEKGVYDESDHIDAVVRATQADAVYLKTDPADIFETVEEMLGYHDEPICTVTWYSLYLLAKKVAAQDIPVILNGHGGDELVAGYWDHYHYHFCDLETEGKMSNLKREIDAWLANHHRDPEEIERSRTLIRRYTEEADCGMSRFSDYADCLTPELSERYARRIRVMPLFRPLLQNRLASELLFETIPASLRPEDRNTMAHSLESRSPFLDFRLVEYCFTLPNRMKIRGGLGKWVHREAMRDILPEDVRLRKDKAGFIAPADEWFRTVNREQIETMMASEEFKNRGIYNLPRIRAVFEEHVTGQKNHQMFIWQLINLELWFRKNFDRCESSTLVSQVAP